MRSKVLVLALAKYGIDPCGDNSCIFGSPGGMATNGGCRCIKNLDGRIPTSASIYIHGRRFRDVAAREGDEQARHFPAFP